MFEDRLTVPSVRDQNRQRVMRVILDRAPLSRLEILQATGLSRSTVARVLDELIAGRFIDETPISDTGRRGRPVLAISASSALGHLVGADIGVTSTRMIFSDVNGKILQRERLETPQSPDAASLADWFGQVVDQSRPADAGPLLQAVVSVPGKIIDGVSIARPAQGLRNIEGSEFYARLARQLGGPVDLRSDPDMALIGELVDGAAEGRRDVALFVVSTALSASVAVDGVQLAGRRSVVGEFSFLPYGPELTLGDVLSVQGILDRAERLGLNVNSIEQFIESRDEPTLALLHQDFRNGLELALSSITLAVDPEIVVLAGRMLPLIEVLLDEVRGRLEERLPFVPELAPSRRLGYSQPRGAIEIALAAVRNRLLASLG